MKKKLTIFEQLVSLLLFGQFGTKAMMTKPREEPERRTLPELSESSALGRGLIQATDYSKDLDTLQSAIKHSHEKDLHHHLVTPLPGLLEAVAKNTMVLGRIKRIDETEAHYALSGEELTQDPANTLIWLSRRVSEVIRSGNAAQHFTSSGVGIIYHTIPTYISLDYYAVTYLWTTESNLFSMTVPSSPDKPLTTKVYPSGRAALTSEALTREPESTNRITGDRELIQRLYSSHVLRGDAARKFLAETALPAGAGWYSTFRNGTHKETDLLPITSDPKPGRRLRIKRFKRASVNPLQRGAGTLDGEPSEVLPDPDGFDWPLYSALVDKLDTPVTPRTATHPKTEDYLKGTVSLTELNDTEPAPVAYRAHGRSWLRVRAGTSTGTTTKYTQAEHRKGVINMIKVTYQIFDAEGKVIETYDFYVQDEASVDTINKMMDANSKNRYEYTWTTNY